MTYTLRGGARTKILDLVLVPLPPGAMDMVYGHIIIIHSSMINVS